MGLAFERVGSGPPLVLLHGIGHRRQAWNAVTGPLAASGGACRRPVSCCCRPAGTSQ